MGGAGGAALPGAVGTVFGAGAPGGAAPLAGVTTIGAVVAGGVGVGTFLNRSATNFCAQSDLSDEKE